MIILKEVIRKNRLAVLLFFVTTAVNTTVFILYDILAEPLHGLIISALCSHSVEFLAFTMARKLSFRKIVRLSLIQTETKFLMRGPGGLILATILKEA